MKHIVLLYDGAKYKMIPIENVFDFKKVLSSSKELDALKEWLIDDKPKRGWAPRQVSSTSVLEDVYEQMKEESGILNE